MVLLRRVIGDALRARRQGQHRTLREVSTAANVSLGYLSEIERGQKEASSELLAAICDALGAQLSELLREVSDTLVLAEQVDGVLGSNPRVPMPVRPNGEAAEGEAAERRETADVPAARPAPERTAQPERSQPERTPEPASASAGPAGAPSAKLSPHAHSALRAARQDEVLRRIGGDGEVTVSIRREIPHKLALRGVRTLHTGHSDRDLTPVG